MILLVTIRPEVFEPRRSEGLSANTVGYPLANVAAAEGRSETLENPMWILMYVFSYSVSPAATNDRTEWRLQPAVVFQEFTSEERCQSAKLKLSESLKDAGDRLKTGLEQLKLAGAGSPSQIIIAYNVECLPK